MLRADRMLSQVAGLVCSAAGIKNKAGRILTAADFDIYNRDDKPVEELTPEKVMGVLSMGKKNG